MTARKPVHCHLSPKPNVTFSGNWNIEYDRENVKESLDVQGSPKKRATPEVAIREKGTPVKPDKEQKDFEESIDVQGSPKKRATPEVGIREKRTPVKLAKEQKIEPSSLSKLLFFGLFVAFVGLAYFMIPSSKTCSFDKLQKQNPVQSQNVWKALQVGIENLLNKKLVTPNVYLFLYQDRQKLQKLTQDIAVETARCFGNQEVIEMQRKDFITQEGDDYGYAIEMYKQKIKKGKVLVIIHLNELPANAARALHTICETVNPIADGVVIFLTLNTWKQVNSNSNSVQLAVDTLQELWGKQLGSNELDPLITRVTDQVLHLKP